MDANQLLNKLRDAYDALGYIRDAFIIYPNLQNVVQQTMILFNKKYRELLKEENYSQETHLRVAMMNDLHELLEFLPFVSKKTKQVDKAFLNWYLDTMDLLLESLKLAATGKKSEIDKELNSIDCKSIKKMKAIAEMWQELGKLRGEVDPKIIQQYIREHLIAVGVESEKIHDYIEKMMPK